MCAACGDSEFISELSVESSLPVKEEHSEEHNPDYIRAEKYVKVEQNGDITFRNSTSTFFTERKSDQHSRNSSEEKEKGSMLFSSHDFTYAILDSCQSYSNSITPISDRNSLADVIVFNSVSNSLNFKCIL